MALTEAERKAALEIAARVFKGLAGEERRRLGEAAIEAISDFLKESDLPKEEVLGLMHQAFSRGFHSEGGRLVGLNVGDQQMAMEVPPEVGLKIDRVVRPEELERLLMNLPWARRWAEEVSRMVIGAAEWARLPEAERERYIARLIREKLVPGWIKAVG